MSYRSHTNRMLPKLQRNPRNFPKTSPFSQSKVTLIEVRHSFIHLAEECEPCVAFDLKGNLSFEEMKMWKVSIMRQGDGADSSERYAATSDCCWSAIFATDRLSVAENDRWTRSFDMSLCSLRETEHCAGFYWPLNGRAPRQCAPDAATNDCAPLAC